MQGVYRPKKSELIAWISCLFITVVFSAVVCYLAIEIHPGARKVGYLILPILLTFTGIVYLSTSRDVLRTIEFKNDCLTLKSIIGEKYLFYANIKEARLSGRVLTIKTYGGKRAIICLDIFFTPEERDRVKEYLRAKIPCLKVVGVEGFDKVS